MNSVEGVAAPAVTPEHNPQLTYLLEASRACADLYAMFTEQVVEKRPVAWANLIQPLQESWPNQVNVQSNNRGYVIEVAWAFEPTIGLEKERITEEIKRTYITSRITVSHEDGKPLQEAVKQVISPPHFSRWRRPMEPILGIEAVWDKNARHYYYPQAALLSQLSQQLTQHIQFVRMGSSPSPEYGMSVQKKDHYSNDQQLASWLNAMASASSIDAIDELADICDILASDYDITTPDAFSDYIKSNYLQRHLSQVSDIQKMAEYLQKNGAAPVLIDRSFTLES